MTNSVKIKKKHQVPIDEFDGMQMGAIRIRVSPY